jgi:hypothetical protein
MASMKRRRMNVAAALAMAAVVAVAAVTPAAGTAQGPPTPKAPKFGNTSNLVTNTWFPLKPGSVYIYEGQREGMQARDVLTVTRKVKAIEGIRAAVVKDLLFQNGRLAERTTDWYAQDKHGTVWYLGEKTAELSPSGKVISTEGSFLHGRDGAKGGIFMPANPLVGQSFQQERYKGHAEDRFRILSLATSVTTPVVASNSAMLTEETTPLEPKNVVQKYYIQGIGPVKEQQVAGAAPGQAEQIQLVSFQAG